MAVNKYDAHTSFMQDTLARFGEQRAEAFSKLNDNQDRSYLDERKKEVDEVALRKLSNRDKERARTDPSFQPKDEDFTQPVTFKYNPQVNYYKVLGIEDLASQDEVKKAYRKLSLVYHPDKTRDLSQEEKDEYAEVFIELKNAYKLLADNPTRRQYDYERDRAVAKSELRGKPMPKDEAAFEAAVALAKLAEKYHKEPRQPSKVVAVQLQCKLEKFVHGGHKAIERDRRVKERFSNPPEFHTESKLYRIHVPPGSEPPFTVEFSKQGDQHADREPDTLKFVVSPEPHEQAKLDGLDLHAAETLDLGEGWHREPYFSADVGVVRGKHELLWGRNPFFRSTGADFGELRVRIAGEGVTPQGSFAFRARMGMKNAPAPSFQNGKFKATQLGPSSPAHRDFIERFKLGPSWGKDGLAKERDAMEAPAMQRKLRKLAAQVAQTCDVELSQVRNTVLLATKPYCLLTFYSNARPSAEGRLPALSIFAIGVSSPPCGKKAGKQDWTRLLAKVVPVLQASSFRIWALARSQLPRAISGRAAYPAWAQLQEDRSDVSANALWKALGDQAFARGDIWQATAFYTRRIQDWDGRAAAAKEAAELLGVDEADWAEYGEQEVMAKVLSNRACCLARLGDFEASLADARRARDLAPTWAKPWGRLGLAAWQLGGELRQEGFEAYFKAVELEPGEAEMARLHTAATQIHEPSHEAAHGSKEEGSLALQHHEPGRAVAHYTVALAQLPAPAESGEDQHALLRAVLLTNRCIALCWLGRFQVAVTDGRAAVAAKRDFQKGRCQLGVALLGCNLQEEAYAEFATAILLEQEGENQRAQKGRKACLLELQKWNSIPAKMRTAKRFGLDLGRPRGSTRVFAISDVYFGKKCNEEWAHAIDSFAFQEDVLIVAGGVSEALGGIVKALTALKGKFRRVFFTPGGLELSIHRSEVNKFADSLSKLYSIYEACDGLGIDVCPGAICAGLYVVPLISWYNAAFDEKDPFPNPNLRFDAGCRWPVDADEQLWRYVMKLNEPLIRPFIPQEPTNKRWAEGEVITFSHFLPRRGLPIGSSAFGITKAIGCEALDEQLRATGSKLHVYGRSGQRNMQVASGVRYAHNPIGEATKDRSADEPFPPLMMVHNGHHVCMHEWAIDGALRTRMVRICLYVMPGIDDDIHKRADLFTLARKFNTMPGIQCSFSPLGSGKLDKDDFSDLMPELTDLSHGGTHALIVVADNLPAMRTFLHTKEHKTEWYSISRPFIQNSVEFFTPLGMELAPGARLPNNMEKEDPMLVAYFMNLGDVNEGSEAYGKMLQAVSGINGLQGAAGRIAASLQPIGFNGMNNQGVLWHCGWPEEKSAGCTFCFMAALDCPASWKLLRQSKTFGRWKASYESHLHYGGLPPHFALVMPLKVNVTTIGPRAPQESKKK